MNPDIPDHIVIKCPYCEMRVDSRDLEEHFNSIHIINPEPCNENISLSKLIPRHNFFIFDGEDFNITDNVTEATKGETKANEKKNHVIPSHPVEDTHIFDDINKIPGNRPSTGSRPIHPKPYEPVNCPICQKQTLYNLLFEHVSRAHEEKNPKIILAEFNREYNRLVKGPTNLPENKPRSDADIQSKHPLESQLDNINISPTDKINQAPITNLHLPSEIVLYLLYREITTIGQLIDALKHGFLKYSNRNEIASLAIITRAINSYASKKLSSKQNKRYQKSITTDHPHAKETCQNKTSITVTSSCFKIEVQSNPPEEHLLKKPYIPQESGIENIKIAILRFPPRINHVLSRHNILTIGQLELAVHEGSIGDIKQIGIKSLQLINEGLASYPTIPIKDAGQKNASLLTSLQEAIERFESTGGDQNSIDVFGFPRRINTVLLRNGVYTIGLLKQAIANGTIADFRNLGEKGLKLITRAIIDCSPLPNMHIPFNPEGKITWASTIEQFLLDSSIHNLSIFINRHGSQRRTLAQIAKEYHVTRERIRQIEKNIINRLFDYLKIYKNQALLGGIYSTIKELGEDLSQQNLRSALQAKNLLGEFSNETKERISLPIDPFDLLISYLEIVPEKIDFAEEPNSTSIPILWKLNNYSIRELRSIGLITNDAKKKVAKKVIFTGGIKLQEAAQEFKVEPGIAKLQLQSMKMTEVIDGWFSFSTYEANKQNIPLRTAGLKMLAACDQLPLNTFCNGLRRHISRSYPGIAPEKVVIYALEKNGFQVENGMVSTSLSTRNALSPSEKCFLQLAQETGPIIIFSEIVERFYSNKLSLPAATRILDKSPIVEKIGARLYMIRGTEVLDTAINKARQRCRGVNKNAEMTYDLDGITTYKMTINSKGYSWGILMVNHIGDLVGSWDIVVSNHQCGEAAVGENYIRGLSYAFERLEISMGDQIEISFDRQRRKLAIKKCSYL